MAKYMCQCGMFLKRAKSSKKPSKLISYKVLIVKTENHYKCPNGCELKTVSTYN